MDFQLIAVLVAVVAGPLVAVVAAYRVRDGYRNADNPPSVQVRRQILHERNDILLAQTRWQALGTAHGFAAVEKRWEPDLWWTDWDAIEWEGFDTPVYYDVYQSRTRPLLKQIRPLHF